MASTSSNERNGGGTATAPWRREPVLETAVFLFLIVPSLALSLFAVRQGKLSFPLTAWAIMFRDLSLVCLILFFLWRNGEPRGRIGWTSSGIWREIAWGIVLFVPFFACVASVELAMRRIGLTSPATPLPSFLAAGDLPQLFLAVVLVTVVAVSEETIFRGYLLLRFGAITGSVVMAVISSSLVFALGHGYEGTAGLATVGVMGVVLAAVYLWRGSLVAPIAIHFLQDFIGIVLVPLLHMK